MHLVHFLIHYITTAYFCTVYDGAWLLRQFISPPLRSDELMSSLTYLYARQSANSDAANSDPDGVTGGGWCMGMQWVTTASFVH